MAHAYTELFYHFVWATKNRAPSIGDELEPHLYRIVRHKCQELRVLVHALNGMLDHLHVACTLPVTLSVTEFAGQVKGTSSHFVNHGEHGVVLPHGFDWQPGYGALTFAKRDLSKIVRYIERQKEHHPNGTLSEAMERYGE